MGTLRQQFATNVLTVTKFRDLLRTMRENRPGDDLELVRRAYEFSQTHHAGQTRASGKPYLIHPLEVALVLADMKMDPVAIAAGLLDDRLKILRSRLLISAKNSESRLPTSSKA